MFGPHYNQQHNKNFESNNVSTGVNGDKWRFNNKNSYKVCSMNRGVCTRACRTHHKNVAFLQLYHVGITFAGISSRPAVHILSSVHHLVVDSNSRRTYVYRIPTGWKMTHKIPFCSDYKLLQTEPAKREIIRLFSNTMGARANNILSFWSLYIKLQH
jgi:hypothetical protein